MLHAETRNQYLSAVCVNILTLGVGASISWTSPYLPFLQGNHSPLDEPLTTNEASWIGSLLAVGALTGSFFFGWLSEKCGRFWSLVCVAIPQILWWSTLIFSAKVILIMTGRFLAGFAVGGTYTLVPIYVTEISQDSVRGSLGSFLLLSSNFGMLLMYAVANIIDYSVTPFVFIVFPFAFLVLFARFPETPVYLLRNNKSREAERSLKFFRGSNKRIAATVCEKRELEKLVRKIREDEMNRKSPWLELKSTAAKKGVFIGVVLMFVNQFSGLFTFLSYASAVFIESGSNFSPNVSALIAGVLLVSGSIFSVLIIDKISRRLFYSLTTIVNIVGLVSMGIYNFLKIHQVSLVENFKFVPVVSLSLVIFVAALGRLPLTYVMMAEIMPQNIRSFGISTANTCNWVFVFILLKSFSLAVEIFQFYMCMFAFSGVLLFGMIFVIFYVPETKKRSFEEIESSLVVKQLKSKKPKTTESRELEKL